MSSTTVTINLVVSNGERYIKHCLGAVLAQSYPRELIELNILDNGSFDETKIIIKNYKLKIENSNFATFNFIESGKNLGMWPGQEELLKYTNGKYVLSLCVDVILDKDFIKNAVEIMEKNDKIGALEAKIYKYDIRDLEIENYKFKTGGIIDTCGFNIFKSRRVTNIGHGEVDKGQFSEQKEIFAVEGAAPFLRREAINDIKINEDFIDHEYFWYGDDLDFAWRMTLLGWKQVFSPSFIAWHDRQTTKTLKKNWFDYILRIPIRNRIPLKKRRLDWKNTRFTIIKNDYIINIVKDLPAILSRELAVFGYTLLFEPKVFAELPAFLILLPNMIKKRREIMKRATVPAKEIKKWFK